LISGIVSAPADPIAEFRKAFGDDKASLKPTIYSSDNWGIICSLLMIGSKFSLKLNEINVKKIVTIINSIGCNIEFEKTPTFKEILDMVKKMKVADLLKDPSIPAVVLKVINFARDNLLADVSVKAIAAPCSAGVKFKTRGFSEVWDYISK